MSGWGRRGLQRTGAVGRGSRAEINPLQGWEGYRCLAQVFNCSSGAMKHQPDAWLSNHPRGTTAGTRGLGVGIQHRAGHPQHPSRLPWFHPHDSSGAGNKHQPGEHHNVDQKTTPKQQGSKKAAGRPPVSASSSPHLPTGQVAEPVTQRGCRRPEGAQTTSHPSTAALIRTRGASRNHNNEGN